MPNLGPTSAKQLEDKLAAAALRQSEEQVARLSAVSAVARGFPHEMVLAPSTADRLAGGKRGQVEGLAEILR